MKIIDNDKILSKNGELESLITSSRFKPEEEITTELINSDKGFDSLEQEWNELAEQADSHVFQSFQWQRLWWKHFGSNLRLHIILFKKNDRLIAIGPFYVEKTPLMFKFSYWRLRFLGCTVPTGTSVGTFVNYSPSDYLDIIVNPEYEDPVTRMFLLYLEKTGDLFNQVDFDEVSEDSFLIRKVLPAMKKKRWSLKTTRRENCPRINLPATMDDYLSDLKSKVRYELRYSKRAVAEKNLFSVKSASTLQEVRNSFSEFVELHQKRWNSQGMPGIFADQQFEDFLNDVTESFFNKGWLKIKTARTEDQVLAVDYAFRFNNRLYDYQKAFDDSSPLSKYGPGKTIFYDLMEESIEEGCTVFDLMRGDEMYKMRIANDVKSNWNVTIPNPDYKRGIKYRCYNFYSMVKSFFSRVGRERLMLKTHFKEHGIIKFIPVYLIFLKNRIRRRNN